MQIIIEERDARAGTTLYEPVVFCEKHGRQEAERMGMRIPESWECCSSSWDHAHHVKTIVRIVKDDTKSRCQTCFEKEDDEAFQKTLAMLEGL